MAAGQRFAAGDKTADIAADLRVGVRQVEKWLPSSSRGWPPSSNAGLPHTVSTTWTVPDLVDTRS